MTPMRLAQIREHVVRNNRLPGAMAEELLAYVAELERLLPFRPLEQQPKERVQVKA